MALLAQETGAAAQEATLRLTSPVPGQEVMIRVTEAPAQGGLQRAVALLGGHRHDTSTGTYEVSTPVEIRLDPVQAFRITFSTISPQQLLRVVLTPGAEREVFVDGSEFMIARPSPGAAVEFEASIPGDEVDAAGQRARRPRPRAPAVGTPGPA